MFTDILPRRWLRETATPASRWHLVAQGAVAGMCGDVLTGPVARALVVWTLPEPTCIRCVLWVNADSRRN